ncbi:unnamed protein product [Ilex paraguariensis]|uniref:Uncharacterized protein n=1 Tax=Ilex paraguariensis TaxID=185542 RepID=A0ABC8T4Q3_9AQUA
MATSPPNCPPFDFSGKYYHISGDGGSCVRQSSFFEGKAVLNQGVGYSVILGFGAFFAVFTSFLIWLEKRYVGSRHTSEWFNTAGRNVKTGLIASVIVSQWTWAATILQSSNVAWEYGISGPFWYASGATIQVLLFGVMAIEIKRKAPHAHTVCEIVKARWGTAAHLVFLAFCFLTNIIVTAMLLLGGSAGCECTHWSEHLCCKFSYSSRFYCLYTSGRVKGHLLGKLYTLCNSSCGSGHLCVPSVHSKQ